MKILFANKYFFINGGSERVFFYERKYLLDKGHQVIDFSMHDFRNFPSSFSDYFVSNIDYHNTKGFKEKIKQGASFIHSQEATNKIENLICIEKPQIAHLHNIYHQLTPSIIPILKRQNVKVVLTLHDGKLICPSYTMLNNGKICTICKGKYFWRPLTQNCQKSLTQSALLVAEAFLHKLKKSYDFVDIFIAPSQFMAKLVEARVPPKKIRILLNGIDIHEFTPTYQDNKYGLYFGRLSNEKGIETLLKAHETIKNSFQLKVVGQGPLEKKLAVDYPKVDFLGYKSGNDLKDIIARSSFVVVPSECYENCSMAILEAMAMGKPVIASNIGGIPEQVLNFKTGILFEKGNIDELAAKMKLLYKDKSLRITMGKAARDRVVQKFSIDKHCNNLLKIYNSLINEK